MLDALPERVRRWLAPARKDVVVGVEFQADGMALVIRQKNGTQEQARLSFLIAEEMHTPAHQLKQWVVEQHVANAACHVVLGPETYQILLVEPPEVPDAELRSAIRWRLKDLLNIPVDQAAIEVFALPADGTRSNKKMVYVVACEAARIQKIVGMVQEAGLSLESIDIAELALRNLVLKVLPDEFSERGAAVVRIRSGAGSVFIYRSGNLYLARTFSLNYGGGLLDDLPEESLALEIQRSLDYYERQMGQLPPAVIYVCGDHISQDKVGEGLQRQLAPKVNWLDFSKVIPVIPTDEQVSTEKGLTTEGRGATHEMDDALGQRCIAALGGALRLERVA